MTDFYGIPINDLIQWQEDATIGCVHVASYVCPTIWWSEKNLKFYKYKGGYNTLLKRGILTVLLIKYLTLKEFNY